MHIAASKSSARLVPRCGPSDALDLKAKAWRDITKIGGPLMDAVPLTLGQEFSGYVAQLDAAWPGSSLPRRLYEWPPAGRRRDGSTPPRVRARVAAKIAELTGSRS